MYHGDSVMSRLNRRACLEVFAVLAINCMLSAPGALIKTFQKSRLAVGHDLG